MRSDLVLPNVRPAFRAGAQIVAISGLVSVRADRRRARKRRRNGVSDDLSQLTPAAAELLLAPYAQRIRAKSSRNGG